MNAFSMVLFQTFCSFCWFIQSVYFVICFPGRNKCLTKCTKFVFPLYKKRIQKKFAKLTLCFLLFLKHMCTSIKTKYSFINSSKNTQIDFDLSAVCQTCLFIHLGVTFMIQRLDVSRGNDEIKLHLFYYIPCILLNFGE